jgi:hypothetical protein
LRQSLQRLKHRRLMINLYGTYLLWFTIVGTLKIIGYCTWSWFWIWSPVWIPIFIIGCIFTLAFIIIGNKGKGM